jgi:predicted pyridoxine 5'-phosphate oxidase superfamily flavin-nucleotide-binding protein
MNRNFTQLAFTDSVKKVQEEYGSRRSYERMESGEKYILTNREIPFIESRDGFYMATVGENGWPYVQFRGGEKGFLKVLDNETLGYADFRGNMQYISVGNINSTRKVSLFLMDYPSRQRLKIWAESEVVSASENPEMLAKLEVPDYEAIIERLIIFKIQGYDWNCPQHITPRFTIKEIEALSSEP